MKMVNPSLKASGLLDDERLILPRTNQWGLLPSGIHDASLKAVESQFAFSPFRQLQWRNLLSFLDWVYGTGNFSHVFIAGGYVTTCESPSDVDIILQTRAPYGPDSFQAMEPFFVEGLGKILQTYGVHLHFWCEGFPEAASDFRRFFQQVRPRPTVSLRSLSAIRKGLVRVALDPPLSDPPDCANANR